MAITWGPRTASINGQFFQLGVDVSISGATVSVAYYFWADAPIAQQGLILTKTGQLSGTQSFAAWSAGQVSIGSWSFTGVRGQTYTVGGRVTGTYNGLSPSVSTTVQIPSLVPGKMAKPVISSITKDSARITGKAPSSGSAITRYNLMLALDAAGARVFRDTTGTSPVFDAGNLPSNQTFWVWMRAENSAGWGAWSDSIVFTTVASGPAAPTAVRVESISGARHEIRWTPNPTANAPYTYQKVQRRTDLGDWVTISGQLSGTQSLYFNGVLPNHRYEWRVVAGNSGGETASTPTTSYQTSPDSPGDFTAGRDSSGNISLAWVNKCSPGMLVKFRVDHSIDGQGWEQLAATPSLSFLHLAPSITVPHHYRVRAEVYQSISAQDVVLTSLWIVSNKVYLAAPPLTPTPLAPEGAVDAGRGITLKWRHNSVDTSPQRAYELRHRLQGTETWTLVPKTSSSASSEVITGYTNGQVVEWQARTWGEHADPSPWSNSVFTLSETPIVTIGTPSSTHNLSTFTLAWAFFQAEGSTQAQWQAELLNEDGVVVETRSGSAEKSRKFSTLLQNESVWKARLRARSAAGLWSDWEEREFQVSYSRPAAPIISTSFIESRGAVEVSIFNPPTVQYSWAGEVENSISLKREDGALAARNRFINPRFEGDFLPPGASFSQEWAIDGARSMYVPPSPIETRPSMIGFMSTFVGKTPVEKMMATPGATWAHRGGSANWPEMTGYAYQQAVNRGYGCVEISMSRTKDGEWFGLHDATLDRVAGVTGNVIPSDLTWQELRVAYNVVVGAAGAPQPFMSWQELLAIIPQKCVVVFDPKYSMGFLDECLAMVKRDIGAERGVFKFSGVGSGAVNAAVRATDAGFHTWGYFYEADVASGALHRDQHAWSLLGMEWNAPTETWNTIKSYGKPVVAHIVRSLAAYDAAMLKGADIAQVADVAGVPAVENWL